MFHLDRAISKWCSALASRSHMSEAHIEELEDHLHDEIRKQQALGSSEEDAFKSAVKRLGTLDELAREYSRNRRVGNALSAIASSPYATKIFGLYLMTGACLTLYSVSAAFLSGRVGDAYMLALLVVCSFTWAGFKGYTFWRGRQSSYGELFVLMALLLIQVPIVGGQPHPGFELSGGLQYAVWFGSVAHHLVFKPGAELHINTAYEAGYLGINLVALVAALFTGLKFFDRWRNDPARSELFATAR